MEKDTPALPKSDCDEYLPRETRRVRSLRWVMPWVPHFILFTLYTTLFATWPMLRPRKYTTYLV